MVIPAKTRSQRWRDGVRKQGGAYLAQRAAQWVQRNVGGLLARSAIALHTLLGRQIPFALRDFWLTSAFLESTRHFAPAPFAGELTLLRAKDVDPELSIVGPELGWSGLASRIQSFEVPGNHFTLLDQPNVDVLAAKLARCMEQAAPGSKQ